MKPFSTDLVGHGFRRLATPALIGCAFGCMSAPLSAEDKIVFLGSDTYKVTINKKLPPFILTKIREPWRQDAATYNVRLEVKRQDKAVVVNNFTEEGGLTSDHIEFTVADVNFDGYQDIGVFSSESGVKNHFYEWYAFRPARKRFEHWTFHGVDEAPANLWVDPENQELHTGWYSPTGWTQNTYRWEGATYTLIDQQSGEDSLEPLRRNVVGEARAANDAAPDRETKQ